MPRYEVEVTNHTDKSAAFPPGSVKTFLIDAPEGSSPQRAGIEAAFGPGYWLNNDARYGKGHFAGQIAWDGPDRYSSNLGGRISVYVQPVQLHVWKEGSEAPFPNWSEGLAPFRLAPIDVGFDPRVHDMPVAVGPGEVIAGSHEGLDGCKWYAIGPRAEVIELLTKCGYRIADL